MVDKGESKKASTVKKNWQTLTRKELGNQVPRRGGIIAPTLASIFLKLLGWEIVGSIPNVPKAVFLALPHTSNFDGLYALPTVLALDLNINIMGKRSLFKNPLFASFLNWVGVIPIDRGKKGSVLQASIDRFNSSDSLYLGLSPEGTREYTEQWKTGFYYLAKGANVPIVPVAMDYKTKQIRFMQTVELTEDMDADLARIMNLYKGVEAKHPEKMSKPLQDINKEM